MDTPGRTTVRLVAASLAAGVALAGCAPGGDARSPTDRGHDAVSAEPGLEVDTGLSVRPAPAPAFPPDRVPDSASGPLWKAPFSSPPRVAGDMLVGLVNPTPAEPKLSVVGVDRSGTTRWSVKTNPACAGFGITRSGDRYLAVVLFSGAAESGEGLATHTTASAFDVRTGERAWGPVEVPGQLRGPGLVFQATSPGTTGPSQGPRTLLSSHDGHVVARESPGVVPHYEHDGRALVERHGVLRVVDTATGRKLWAGPDIPVPPGIPDAAARGITPEFSSHAGSSDGGVVALDWTDANGHVVKQTLHDLRTGRRVLDLGAQTEVSTHVDPASGVVVAVSPGEKGVVTAADLRTGAVLWQRPQGETSLSLSTVRDGVAYGDDGPTSVKIDLRTGATLTSGSWQVPQAVTEQGLMVVTTPPAPDGTQDYVAFRRNEPHDLRRGARGQ